MNVCPACLTVLKSIGIEAQYTCPECGHSESFDFWATQEIELFIAIQLSQGLVEATDRYQKIKRDGP